ncbi:Dimethylsulfide methyltransferase corrinoid protein [Methanosarcina sp. MTP4]|uniref:corrinoid protein n=1 Tax=Methanosarcina sp. MTP4 TaxID=1434100 RepID=UPI000615EA30|nr:corrinoid protein [Methanosarcina sp. MTP4]AKB26518.1 Dimethylsulfide methyltransferase corrinoid protein [Methanosarcina sp. MTP4]
MAARDEILNSLAEAVVKGDASKCVELANKALENNVDAYDAVINGCANGMSIVSDKYEKREMFVPEILLAARAMQGAVEIFKPHIKADEIKESGRVAIGVVLGDIHDIGKNLVKLLLETAGLTVFDLGKDVLPEDFQDKIKEEHVDLVALSALMTTSMMEMKEDVKLFKEEFPGIKIMVGGAPVSQEFCDNIGADGYADNASEAIRVAQRLLSE